MLESLLGEGLVPCEGTDFEGLLGGGGNSAAEEEGVVGEIG